MYILGTILIVIGMILLKTHLSYTKEVSFVDPKNPNKKSAVYVRGIGSIQYYKAVQTITDKMPRVYKSNNRLFIVKFLNECMYKDNPSEQLSKILGALNKLIEQIEKRKDL
jgi:hypothetical protein